MTNKECIEQLKAVKNILDIVGTDYEVDLDHEPIERAIEALEKQERYRWHDLRENPGDLPDGEGYQVLWTDGLGYGTKWVFEDSRMDCDAIAWKEIEPFEEVSE